MDELLDAELTFFWCLIRLSYLKEMPVLGNMQDNSRAIVADINLFLGSVPL